VAVRSYDRPVPELSFPARVARAFAYVLLVVTCTVIAAIGGYQLGSRSGPTADQAAAERTTAVHGAVGRAVAAQKARDRALRRDALKRLAAFQRDRFESEMAARVAEVRLAEAANAARAYRRGKVAGRVAAVETAAAKAEAEGAKPAREPASQR
jgi:hypothetical protein